MTENQELKMQLLNKFAITDTPATIDFCREAYKFLTEGEAKPQAPVQKPATDTKADGFYLIYENGEVAAYNPIYGDANEFNDSPVKYIGIKWGSRTLKVSLHDMAGGEDITLTATEDKTKGYKRYIETCIDAVADWNGKDNTEHLKDIGLNKEIKLADGEYIPALGELYFIYLNRKALNEILEKVGGEPIADEWYWTSTESSATYAWSLYLSGGGVGYGFAKASTTLRVRAVSAFIL